MMGSLGFGGIPTLACACFIPARTYSKSSIELVLKGSSRPCGMCVKRIPERYDLIV